MLEVTGLDAVLQNLIRLNIDESVENKALNKAGKIMQKAVQNEAPVDKGTLKKNIKLKRPQDGEVVIHTGGAYHAHLVEFGRSGGSTNGQGGRRVSWGPTAPNPFFSRGFEQSNESAKQAMIDEIRRELGL